MCQTLMKDRPGRVAAALTWLIACTFFAAPAVGQTGPELLLKPFRTTDQLEVNASALIDFDGETDNVNPADGESYDFNADVYDLSGRLRLTPGTSEEGIARAQPRAGFAFTGIDVSSNDPLIPERLVDYSAAVGMGVLAYEGWLGGISVGAGYTGADVGDDANALYFQADFAVGKTFSNGVDSFGVVLDYNGNRSFLPDWPLPGFQYRKRLDSPRDPPRGQDDALGPATTRAEQPARGGFDEYDPSHRDPARLILALGFPFSGVEWRPDDRFRLQVNYQIPDIFTARADYDVIANVGLYASFENRLNAFHWDELAQGSDRIFYRQNYVESGLQWTLDDRLSLIAAFGYAFNRDFEVGFDTRDTENLAEISDEPYGRLALQLRL